MTRLPFWQVVQDSVDTIVIRDVGVTEGCASVPSDLPYVMAKLRERGLMRRDGKKVYVLDENGDMWRVVHALGAARNEYRLHAVKAPEPKPGVNRRGEEIIP